MTNQSLTHEEVEQVVALWRQQKTLAEAPKITDVAESLDVTPEHALLLLERVRRQQEWTAPAASSALASEPLTPREVLNPVVSITAAASLGLCTGVCTWLTWEAVCGYVYEGQKVALLVIDAGLWTAFMQYTRFLYRDISSRRKRL